MGTAGYDPINSILSVTTFCLHALAPQSEWCQLTSAHAGLFWFNKYTGETHKDVDTAPSNDRYYTLLKWLLFLQNASYTYA